MALKLTDDALAAGLISDPAVENMRLWLTGDAYAEFHDEICADAESGQWDDLQEAFYTRIRFETAGMRGPCGAGPNRINSRTIAEAVQGVCDFVRSDARTGRLRAVVCYDTRIDSAWFAQVTAQVLVGNDIEVHLFAEPRPTPELSHAILALEADIGFMCSASHNPPADNGLKAYGAHAGQMLPDESAGVIECAAAVTEVKTGSLDQAYLDGNAITVGPEMGESYHAAVLKQARSFTTTPPERVSSLVYTTLHGLGKTSVIPVLEAAGWCSGDNLRVVESQQRLDPKFRGAPGQIPNPENRASLDAGVAIAEALGADLLIATDPDADRMAIHVNDPGKPVAVRFPTGGQLAALLTYWALHEWHAKKALPTPAVVARNVVTCDLVDDVAKSFDATVVNNIPVGFKYVAKVIKDQDDKANFVLGVEQSYGALIGAHCADKDAAVSALIIAELCDHLKQSGRTILDLLDELWCEHGYYAERTKPVRMEGEAGMQRIRDIMQQLRDSYPETLAGQAIAEVKDVLHDHVFTPGTGGETTPLNWGWTDENILIGVFADDPKSWVVVRPSGTEPSLKIYTNIRAAVSSPSDLPQAIADGDALAEAVESEIIGLMGID